MDDNELELKRTLTKVKRFHKTICRPTLYIIFILLVCELAHGYVYIDVRDGKTCLPYYTSLMQCFQKWGS